MREVNFRLIPNQDHPLSERLWQLVERDATGIDPIAPEPLIRLLADEDAPWLEVSLEEAEAVRAWCFERKWWPRRGPSPLSFQRVPPRRGPRPSGESAAQTAAILVPLTPVERASFNAEATRLGITQRELARRKILGA
jgi:hypothetical protein